MCMQTVAAGHVSYYRHVSRHRHVSHCRLSRRHSRDGALGVLSSKAPTQTGLKLKPQNSGLIAATRPTQPSHSTDRAGWLPLCCPGHEGFIYFNFCPAAALVGHRAGARAVSRVHEILGLQIQAGPSPAQPAGSASTSTRPEYTFYTTTTTTTALLQMSVLCCL